MNRPINFFLRLTGAVIIILQLLATSCLQAAVDYTYARLFFRLDPNVKFIAGTVNYHFSSSTLDTLTLNLASNMIVDSVVFHQQLISNFYFAPADLFIVPLPQVANAADSIQVYYHGVPNTSGLGSFKQEYHAGAPILSTLSQPYGASDWMPCVNNLRDKLDSVDCFLTCSNAYIAVTNGVLVDSFSNAGYTTFHYKHRYPIATYLIGIAVSNYTFHQSTFSINNQTFPFLNYTYPEDETNWMNGAQQMNTVMNIFDSLFGMYPFANEHYGMLQANLGGGMEHQTITFMKEYNNEVASHELGHQWFGDKVTCGSWHDLWINEGFATYMTGLVYENTENGYWWPIYLKDRMNKVMLEPGGTVYIPDTTSTSRMFDERLTYYKAAMVLHQLRNIIGDSAFFSACKNFLNSPALAYGFARGSDLKFHFEQSSGLDLTYYFDQWIYGEGYPIYSIQCTAAANSSFDVSIAYTTSTTVTTQFKLPVPIYFHGANNDTLIYFNCENSQELFNIQLPFTPDYFVCDPNYQIIAKSNAMNAVQIIDADKLVTLFPTVTKDILYIANHQQEVRYEIVNQRMQTLVSGWLESHEMKRLQLDALANGLYYLRVCSTRGSLFQKFVKVN